MRLVEAGGGESVVLTLGPAEAVEQLRDAMALGIDRGIHLESRRGVGSRGDRRRDRRGRPRGRGRSGRSTSSSSATSRPTRAASRSACASAHALGRPCATGLKGVAVERRRGALRAGGGRRPRRLRRAAARRADGARGPQLPALPVRAGPHARRAQAARDVVAGARPASRLEKVRLVVPEGQSKQAEVLGQRRRSGAGGRRDAARTGGGLGAARPAATTPTARRPTSRCRP